MYNEYIQIIFVIYYSVLIHLYFLSQHILILLTFSQFFFFYMYQSCHDEEDDDGEEEVKSFEVRWIFHYLSFIYVETLFHSL